MIRHFFSRLAWVGLGLLAFVLPSPFAESTWRTLDPQINRQTLNLEWIETMGRESSSPLIALPDLTLPKFTVEVEEWGAPLNETQRDKNCNAELTSPVRFRDLSVTTLNWTGCGYNGKEYRQVKRAVFHLNFSTDPSQRHVFAGDEASAQEQFYRKWLVNYGQSKLFRLPSTPMSNVSLLKKTQLQGSSVSIDENWAAHLPPERVLLSTTDSGLYVVTGEDLRRAGVKIDRFVSQQLRLWHQGIEQPIFVSGSEDGRLDPNDEIEFIGAAPHTAENTPSPFTNRAVFILTWDQRGQGMRTPLIPVASKDTLGAPPYRVRYHAEEDHTIMRIYSTAEQDISDLGTRVEEEPLSDYWMWNRIGVDKDQLAVPFQIPYTPVATTENGDSSTTLSLKIALKGITNDLKANPDHHLKFFLNGKDISLNQTVTNDAIWEGQATFEWNSGQLPISLLQAGKNVLTLQKVNDLKNSEGQPLTNQDAFLNWIEVSFPARYIAVGDHLRFGNQFDAPYGGKTFRLSGFSTPKISLWDLRGRKLNGYRVKSEGASYSVLFTDTLVTHTEYYASEMSHRARPGIRLDTLPELLNPKEGADWICITESPVLGSALDSLVKLRASQGLRTRVVQTRHLYQAFGDGSTDPEALRRFLRQAYFNWPRPAPLYVLLLGETTNEYDKDSLARANLVPTHLINIRGWGVAASDDALAKVSGDDDIPDLWVGRIPVNNAGELSKVVNKLYASEKERPAGAWRNQAMLIAGYESSFAEATQHLQAQALENSRQVNRIDLFPGSNYFKPPSERKDFYRQLDSAFQFIQFFGHGGGAVWSDAGILTLKALDEDSLKGEWPIPLVSSITCLTGYYEDPSERSLGEELVRRPLNGAAAFYGSSGYISNAAGQVLSGEMLEAALTANSTTVGALIGTAELRTRQKTGNAFLPILAEFNLLGDPAMTYSWPEVHPNLTVDPRWIKGESEVSILGSSSIKSSPSAQLVMVMKDSVHAISKVNVQQGKLEAQIKVTPPEPATSFGHAFVHVFDDTHSEVLSGNFSGLQWIIDSLKLLPEVPSYGDSVKISFQFSTPSEVKPGASGILFYGVSGDTPERFENDHQIGLTSEDGRHFSTARPFMIPTPTGVSLSLPKIWLALRLSVNIKPKGATDFENLEGVELPARGFELKARPYLSLAPKAIVLPWQDKLGVWVRYQNQGPGIGSNFNVSLSTQFDDSISKQSVTINHPLSTGKLDSVFFDLPEIALLKPLHVELTTDNPGDQNIATSHADTVFNLMTTVLNAQQDSFVVDLQSLRLHRQPHSKASYRIFVETFPLIDLPDYLVPRFPGSAKAWWIKTSETAGEQPILVTPEGSGAAKLALDSIAPTPPRYWHWLAEGSKTWIRLDTLSSSNYSPLPGEGRVAKLSNSDHVAPSMALQSRGQTLLPDDFIPRHTPIDIVVQDAQGLNMSLHPPQIFSHGKAVDSTLANFNTTGGTPSLARLSFTPAEGPEKDTLEIHAWDVSGNEGISRFAYRQGSKLDIRNLGSYPNPFADSAIFVYTLTDWCEKVSLKVYSRAGRLVRELSDAQAVGYREVVWDGRTQSGESIANGLYFLKVTAQSGSRESTALFKLFKKKRR